MPNQEFKKSYEKSARKACHERSRKVFIRTFGCQMNVSDSERMAGVLADAGYKITEDESEADIVLLNTCCVRQLAEEKVWSKLGELYNRDGGKKILGVVGCMAQRYGESIFNRTPYVSMVCGTYRFHKIGELLERVYGGKKVVDIECIEDDLDGQPKGGKGSVCKFIPISRGCNNNCSYCIVPYVRGPERNRLLGGIISEIEKLIKNGCKEVTLLGQNVNSYKDKDKNFVDLLREVNLLSGIKRIRFITSHPKDAGIDLFRAMGELDKVCECLHLPVQSGSNKILERMNRGYTREHYMKLIDKVRKIVPGIALSTDIIVGFPGETEEDFRETYQLIKEVGFDSAFIFKYSARPGTHAAKFKDDVPIDVKKERNQCLLKLQDDISLKKNNLLVGGNVEVLIEGVSKNNKNRLMGRTRTNRIVVFTPLEVSRPKAADAIPLKREGGLLTGFSGGMDLVGHLVNVQIVDATAYTLYGKRLGGGYA